MGVLFIDEYGACVRYSGGRIVVSDKDGGELASLRTQELEVVVICANASITSAALSAVLRGGIDTVFLDPNGRYLGRMQPAFSKNIRLRSAQYEAAKNESFRLSISRSVVVGKLANMRTILMRHARYRGSHEILARAQRIAAAMDMVELAESVETVLAAEGTATREYFGAFSEILKPPFTFEGRRRRPPTDPVNAMLGFGYALLASLLGSAVYAAGLDPFLGFYHKEAYGRESLVLDLMEEFRPVIVDSVVIATCNRGMIDPSAHFEKRDGGVYLNKEGRSLFFRAFHSRMREEVQPREGEPAVQYSRLLYMQARKMAHCIATRNPKYQPFLVR